MSDITLVYISVYKYKYKYKCEIDEGKRSISK